MRAVILVGGFGTRLRPLTLTTPKQMLPVVDVPMIERKIAHLVAHGVDDIVLSMGYRPDSFRSAYPEGTCAGARLTYVEENQPLGTAGALAFAARAAGVDSTFLAMNGDTLTDLDVGAVIALHRSRGAEGTLALTPVDDPSRFGVVPVDEEGRVQAFIEKPPPGTSPTNLINAGTYVLEQSFLDRIPADQEVSIERATFPAVVAEGRLFAGHFDRYWLDVGTPEAYLQGNLDVLDRDESSALYIGEGSDVHPDSSVARSVVGRGSVVGAGARLHEAVLLPGAVVEAGSVIERSMVGRGAHIGAGARLTGLTVVGDGVAVDAEAQLDGAKVGPPD